MTMAPALNRTGTCCAASGLVNDPHIERSDEQDIQSEIRTGPQRDGTS